MLNVIVIDDEEIIRRGISNKVRRLVDDVNVVAEASDGEEGLVLTEQWKPDVVVTDIKMPKIDGLHFIMKAQEISPDTHFIILSGYEDFNYARQAVRLGVSDYLLKPVDNNELVRAMEDIRTQIQRSSERKEYISDLNSRVSATAILKKNRLLNEILSGDIADEPAILKKASEIGYDFRNKYFTAFSLQIQLPQSRRDDNDGLLRFAMANVFEESLSKAGVCAAFEHADPQRGVAVILNHGTALPELTGILSKGIQDIRRCLEVEAYVGAGTSVDKPSDIAKSYRDALTAARQKLVFTEQSVITYQDYEQIRKNSFLLGEEDRRIIVGQLSSMALGGSRELLATIDSYFKQIRERKIPYQKVKELCMDILLITASEIRQKNSQMFEELSGHGMESHFEDCRFLGDFYDRICSVLNNLSVHFEQENMSGGKKIVAAIRKKIEEEYYLDLKLGTFATNYYINKAYLSSLFLQEAGRNFSQFLTETRVEKAKEFLRQTELPILKVSELVGYNDRSYFCAVFQKATGISPAKYRQQSKEPAESLE